MIIFKTTNKIDGKIYIGKAINKSEFYLGSGKLLKFAVSKYGIENFLRETIDIAETRAELAEKEIFWINFYKARDRKIGYNITKGGEGFNGPHSKETREKISKISRQLALDPEHGKKISKALLGKKHTAERRRNESLAKQGEKHPCYGKHHSEETKRRNSESNTIAYYKRHGMLALMLEQPALTR